MCFATIPKGFASPSPLSCGDSLVPDCSRLALNPLEGTTLRLVVLPATCRCRIIRCLSIAVAFGLALGPA